MNKLLYILIIMLFVPCASATTLHGTAVDLDTGIPLNGVDVWESTQDKTDASGKFDITVKDSGCFVKFECELSDHYGDLAILPMSGYSEYYADTDEIWLIFRVRHLDSSTPLALPGTDPTHPGPDNGNASDGNTTTTPAGNSITSTASRWGGAFAAALLSIAAVAVLTLAGIISAPAIATIAIIAGLAALVGFVVLPILAKIPIIGQLAGGVQDAGAWLFDQLGFDLSTSNSVDVGAAITDGIAEITHTITENVIEKITETIIEHIIDPVAEATGLSDIMIWAVLGIAVVFIAMMWYSYRQNRSVLYTATNVKDRIIGGKK